MRHKILNSLANLARARIAERRAEHNIDNSGLTIYVVSLDHLVSFGLGDLCLPVVSRAPSPSRAPRWGAGTSDDAEAATALPYPAVPLSPTIPVVDGNGLELQEMQSGSAISASSQRGTQFFQPALSPAVALSVALLEFGL
jgi:hypothetical protein